MAGRPPPRQLLPLRSASAARLPTVQYQDSAGSKHDPLDLQVMTVPQRIADDGVLSSPRDVQEEKESRRPATQRSGVAAECGLCLDEFLDSGNKVPRNLHCGHTFCTDCVHKLMFYKANCRPEVDCPKCHTITPVPDSKVDNLPKNFGLLEVITSSVAPRHHAALADPPQNTTNTSQVEHPICQVHKDHISSYCVEDDTLVCSTCQLYGKHKGHKCLLVTDAAEWERAKLRRLNPEVDRQRERMQCSLAQVQDTLQEVERNGGVVLDAVDAQFSLLSAALEKRRKELRVEVMERAQVRVHALMTQAADLRDNIERATAVYGQTASLIVSSDFTLLQGSSLALEKVEGVFTNPPSSLPSAGPDLTVDFSEDIHSDITSHLEGFGTIKSVAGTVQDITVDEYHDGFRIYWNKHSLADNEGISYHLQGLVGKCQPGENDYVILYRGGNTKFTWKKELQKYVPYQFRVQVRTTEGVGNWSSPVTAFKAEPGFRWHESRRNVRVELSSDKLEASLSKTSGSQWATFAGNRLIENGQLYVELNIRDTGKNKPGKEKLAFGVIECTQSTVNSLSWQECKTCVGQLESARSFAYLPLMGTKNCDMFPDGKPFANSIQLEVDDKLGMLINNDDRTIHFFHNGMDLGLAFDNIRSECLLPAVSIRDKVRVRLCFPPPPYSQRDPKIVRLASFGVSSQRYRKRT